MDIERDAPDLVELTREVNPTAVLDAASLVHRMQSAPARADARGWVAEIDGRAVARAECFRNFFTEGSRNGFVYLAVREEYRRRGIGSALSGVAQRYAAALDLEDVLTSFHENEGGIAFASRHGFTPVRAEAESVLDPREVDEAPSPHVDLRPVSAVDPRLVYEVDLQATRDMPQTEPVDHMPYEEWEQHVLQNPLFTAEGSFVAIVDGVAAAVSLLTADPESGRAHNMFTGTLRHYRGRGLALAAKLASIRWAVANGITTIATSNDETNAPMLAINRRLGYRPAGRRVEYRKHLS